VTDPAGARRPWSLSRRRWLGGAVAFWAAGAGGRVRAGGRPEVPRRPAEQRRADACVFVLLRGGASQLETFDPRPEHPNGAGVPVVETSVAGLRYCAWLPGLARRAKMLATVRSLTGEEANHERALSILRTGHAARAGQVAPGLGAALAAGYDGVLPGHVVLGGAGQPAGPLGAAFGPFRIHDPRRGVPGIRPPRRFGDERRRRVVEMRRVLDEGFAARTGDSRLRDRAEVIERTVALLESPALDVFELDREPDARRRRYGMDRFGQSCLLARRLVEAGVPYVEVELGGYDTHEDHLARAEPLARTLDRGLSALLDDLAASGRLSRTVVVVAGEFGRSPRMNRRAGRDHHPALFSALVAGGGVPAGSVVGAGTADGMAVDTRPVTVPDLLRSVATLLGLPPDLELHTGRGRPLVLLGDGASIPELVGPPAGA